jgi:hypothetical protein
LAQMDTALTEVLYEQRFDEGNAGLDDWLLDIGPIGMKTVVSKLKIALCCSHLAAF